MKDLKGLEPSDYLKILWRRRWYALAVFILTIGISSVYSFRKPDVFRSSSMILVEEPPVSRDYVRPSDASGPKEKIDAVRQQIQSRTFIERMIQEFQLFGYGTSDDFMMDRAVLAVRSTIEVQSTSRNTFSISYSAIDAQLAQAVTRRIVDSLIQSSNSARKSRAVGTDQFLDEQLRQTEQALQAQEERIKEFKSAHLGRLPEQSNENIRKLEQLTDQLSETDNALESLYTQQRQLVTRAEEQKKSLELLSQSMLTDPSFSDPYTGSYSSSDPRLQAKEAELETLLSKYTPSHPDVIRVSREVEEMKRQLSQDSSEEFAASGSEDSTMDAVTARDPVTGPNGDGGSEEDWMLDMIAAEMNLQAEILNNDIEKKKKDRASILNRIRVYENQVRSVPELEQQLAALGRQRDILARQYSGLVNDKFQAQLTTNLETNRNTDSYRIIDEANLPEKPIFPDRKQMAFMGLGAAFLLAMGASFGRELLDSTLSSEEETAKVLKLPVLVSVYEISRKHEGQTGKGRMAESA